MSSTDKKYWDENWSKLPVRIVSADDHYYGSRCPFLYLLKREVGELCGKSVIEIGGGGSYILLAIAKWAKANVTALDYSEVGIAKTREIFKINQCDVETITADFLTWKSDKYYDVVVHWGVLEHFADPLPFLISCSRLLLPSSKMVFSMPNMEAWATYFWKRWSPISYARHIYHSDSKIRQNCIKAGLVVENIFHFGNPMLQRSPWEIDGITPRFFSLAQRGINLMSRFFPLYKLDCKYISLHRGFTVSLKD